jgi:signal transduction histidine kinase
MFRQAKWKLTGWYVLIISLISLTFSGVIYQLIGGEIDRLAFQQRTRWERRLEMWGLNPGDFPRAPLPPWGDPDLAIDAKRSLLVILLGANGGILIISGGLAYFLAGLTLKPIGEMMEEQNRFVADASHELKTPLTALKSSLEVFLRDPKPKMSEVRDLVKGSVEEVDQLQLLSENLLTLAKNQPTRSDKKEAVKLKIITQKVINKFEKLAQTKKIVLVNNAGEESVTVHVKNLEIILTNLIDNAIKYGKAGGKVEAATKRENKRTKLIIKDNGIGIDNKDLPHIFERFYRADEARTKFDGSGFGLGLAMVYKLAADEGASIDVVSTKGRGSSFSVNFQ